MIHLDWLATAFSFAGLYLLPRKTAGERDPLGRLGSGGAGAKEGTLSPLLLLSPAPLRLLSALHVRTLMTWRAVR